VIEGSVVGADALAARLAAMPRILAANLAQAVERLSRALREDVERNLSGAVLQQRSGQLASSIEVAVEQSGVSVTATLGTDVPYAAIHEYGGLIPARELLPRSARALAFPWQGRQRFFKRVSLPAVEMPERSFLRSALEEAEPEIRAALTAAALAAASGKAAT
jgi:phage gpG-like protein